MVSTHTTTPVYIHACGSHSALGLTETDIHDSLTTGESRGMTGDAFLLNDGSTVTVGRATDALPAINPHNPHHNTRNNQLAASALLQMRDKIEQAKVTFGADRIAVVVGSSTSGISDGELALKHLDDNGALPEGFHYYQQELCNLSDYINDTFGLTGLHYVVSTACSSSGRVFITAKRLLKAGLADAVIVGGTDSLCALTPNGFHSLDSVSSSLCQPFGAERDGINIGEAAAFMLLSLTPPDNGSAIALLGAGDSSDAHHISAPEPEGKGAEEAMRKALKDAGLSANDIGYVNAHGTSTRLNDAMESKAILRVLGDQIPVSSTKPLTGHTLGAASAIEAVICWHILNHNLSLPVPAQTHERDLSIAPIRIANHGEHLERKVILSNSFAFGGNNVCLIFGKL
ncbi:beta-ketoacyl-[acyl-carrier-protein] synthase family protein [Enterovibrio sp. ZSDZ42]|uniref:Beta-ketoacyl-[acyl-carrier-protein] synthase family protein n=1 Tax=Enterovibrio gelatinilyticus TaxID=2899819 RepID=A0ABT5QVX1_9GAMM|nr:beta-ketoacyl-[acyl-carrier-protein] synthase family protein [Enterovibrio sp. ZSDZ42]MDD1791879.1 beta-ketoacyl-[acyl-carrier-protein] synthase family protein [Enterovibrio sp. ZSDZ42]